MEEEEKHHKPLVEDQLHMGFKSLLRFATAQEDQDERTGRLVEMIDEHHGNGGHFPTVVPEDYIDVSQGVSERSQDEQLD